MLEDLTSSGVHCIIVSNNFPQCNGAFSDGHTYMYMDSSYAVWSRIFSRYNAELVYESDTEKAVILFRICAMSFACVVALMYNENN